MIHRGQRWLAPTWFPPSPRNGTYARCPMWFSPSSPMRSHSRETLGVYNEIPCAYRGAPQLHILCPDVLAWTSTRLNEPCTWIARSPLCSPRTRWVPIAAFRTVVPDIDATPQGFPDHWAASDTYIPTADGLEFLSNGYGFYEVRFVPTQRLYKPGPTADDDPPARDQFRPPRFFSPEEPDTPPRTPASTTASAPSPEPATPP